MMEPAEIMEIDDIEVFEVLNNPMRFRILRQLTKPRSIREVAENLNMPPTRLYYHFNLLEEAGIIAVVETRKVGAMLQKVYQTAARGFRPSAKLSTGDHEPREMARIAAGVVLDGARVDAEEALAGYFTRVREGADDVELTGSIGRSSGFLTRDRAREFVKKLEKLVDDVFDDEDAEGTEYGFSFVFFPLAGAETAAPE